MPPTIKGQPNDFQRVKTGLYSLDYLLRSARGEVGLPANTAFEIYGTNGIGKSTLATALAGKFCAVTGGKRIDIADLETSYENEHLAHTLEWAGFDGEAWMTPALDTKGKSRSHEVILQETIDALLDKSSVAIIDSLGAITPTAEMDNDLTSANMGKRAQLVAKMNRRIIHHLRESRGLKMVFQVNHQYATMDGNKYGRLTPGGNSKEYFTATRLSLSRKEEFEDTGACLLAIKADKMRLGGRKKKERAHVMIVPGYGISWQMTAVFDCIVAGLAERAKSGYIKVEDEDGVTQNAGRISGLFTMALAGDPGPFAPFLYQLEHQGFVNNEVEDTEESEE
jgi:RecA/RadA recombinase